MATLSRDAKIFIAGHRGLVGSGLVRFFEKQGFKNCIVRTRSEVDLMSNDKVEHFFDTIRPEYVIIAAAKVGGIAANIAAPVDFLIENLQIQNNLMMACRKFEVKKTVFLGSSCIYPREAPQPMREDSFMTGPVEPTNESYAIAKIAGIRLAKALRQQCGLNVICPMPSNIYGPGDHFEYERSHVMSAMVRRFVEAKRNKVPTVTLWGTGKACREFLFVDDLADACLFLLENYDSPEIINVGSGEDVSILQLATTVARIVGYKGTLEWDSSKPDGMPRKLMEVSRLRALGWRHKTDLDSGIAAVVADFEKRFPN